MSKVQLVGTQSLQNSLNTIVSEFRLRRGSYIYEPEPKDFNEASAWRLNGKITPEQYKHYAKKFGELC